MHVKSFSLNFFDSDSSWVITTSTGKPDRPTDRFSGLMGLDGIFRESPPAPYGINASKGRWLNEHTFAIERRILGRSEPRPGRSPSMATRWTLALRTPMASKPNCTAKCRTDEAGNRPISFGTRMR
jgi:hypothetical protein